MSLLRIFPWTGSDTGARVLYTGLLVLSSVLAYTLGVNWPYPHFTVRYWCRPPTTRGGNAGGGCGGGI